MNPKENGYRFPAEWEKHEATWLTWPYLDSSFPGKLESVYPSYIQFIKQLSQSEKVRINVPDNQNIVKIELLLDKYQVKKENIEFYLNPSNDVWCRDHGPAFLVNGKKKMIVSWEFNAWGGKYPSDLDNLIPEKIAAKFGLDLVKPGIFMEGGSIDVNGNGTLLSTTSCLLNKNRNVHLNQKEIEKYLCDYYCVEQVFWLGNGIAGDDTDGHIDDITRFVNSNTIITMVEANKSDVNYQPLRDNLENLKRLRLKDGKQPDIIEIQMPDAVFYDNQRLPASYANFYISNSAVIVPTFRCKQDDVALKIISEIIKDRPVVGIDSVDIVWGFGSFHCLSQQEPAV